MLRVEAGNKRLELDWEHDRGLDFTVCSAYEGTFLVAEAIAQKHPKDPYVKEVGRKVSLAKVLHLLFPRNVAARALVWQAYFARKGKV